MSNNPLRIIANLALAAFVSGVIAPPAMAQAPGSKAAPSFEVVSIKLNKSGDTSSSSRTNGGELTVTNLTLRSLIRDAYRLLDIQLIGGPDWTSSDRFDIVATKGGRDQSNDQVQLMFKSLLADRFHLVVHSEVMDMPVYALTLARADRKLGPTLVRSKLTCGPTPETRTCGFKVNPSSNPATFVAGFISMADLSRSLAPQAHRLILDRTGLAGEFDIDLTWTPEAAVAFGPSLFTALQEQLGLKLESTRGPVEVLVIDRAERPAPD